MRHCTCLGSNEQLERCTEASDGLINILGWHFVYTQTPSMDRKNIKMIKLQPGEHIKGLGLHMVSTDKTLTDKKTECHDLGRFAFLHLH